VAAGHEVTVAARGASGDVPAGARHVPVDRSVTGAIAAVADRTYDAVIDIARRPSWVRAALDVLSGRTAHWTFVSSCSVYADEQTPGQRADAALKDLPPDDVDETDMEHYGALKGRVRARRARRHAGSELPLPARADRRPRGPERPLHLLAGRLAAGGEVLAPGSPDDLVQLVDVRDLAAWVLTAAGSGLTGAFDAISAPLGRGELLDSVRSGVGSSAELVWVPPGFLVEQQVEP
jgi:hypothetical protein